MFVIYCIYNKSKNKYYIGSTKEFLKRMNQHQMLLYSKRHPILELQDDYNNKNEFEFKILKELKTESELESWENYYIGKFDSLENGYNSVIARRKIKYIQSVSQKDDKIDNEPLVRKSEIIKLFNITEKQLNTFLKEGMPCFRFFTGTKRYSVKDVKQWLKEQKGK